MPERCREFEHVYSRDIIDPLRGCPGIPGHPHPQSGYPKKFLSTVEKTEAGL
jgi:hypothetical protein